MSEFLIVRGVRTHNLKNISLEIPKNKLVVITGVSGSWKSSLAFDTIYSAWQRRYLESLSTYARMVVGDGTDESRYDEISGLSPTIAIYQKTVSNNPRSTVWTITEIYDYLRLIFTTISHGYCPNHPLIELKKDTLYDVIARIELFSHETKYYIMIPFILDPSIETLRDLSNAVASVGFVRYRVWNMHYTVADMLDMEVPKWESVWIVVDRLIWKGYVDTLQSNRIKDSITLAFEKWNGKLRLWNETDWKFFDFSTYAACTICGYSLPELTLSHFSFNSHYGACPTCHGLGMRSAFLEDVITNPSLTLSEGALLPWQNHPYYSALLEAFCKKHHIRTDIPYSTLKLNDREKILHGTNEILEVHYTSREFSRRTHHAKYEWLIPNLERRFMESDQDNDIFVKRIASYVTEIVCSECWWYRLKKEFLSLKISGYNIWEISSFSVSEAETFFRNIILSDTEKKIAEGALKNIRERLSFLSWVWLEYITLNRRANTLSWWESQRIRLATQIGTRLEGIIYVLDEPSIGLHPRDNAMLIENLKRLVSIGNTVLVVEHDEDIMRESDYIIDIWPHAGRHGGEVIFTGRFSEILSDAHSETWAYLSKKKRVLLSHKTRKPHWYISIYWAQENNLKNINVRIPLWVLTVVTGVSGSGKSSLVMDILANASMNFLYKSNLPVWKHERIEGLSNFDKSIIIDQSPIWKTPHSNIATYTGLFTHIREVFASSLDAQKRWYWPGRFSFNTKWWRCEVCEGSGSRKVVMHFLPDVYVECETCHGTRYNNETLSIFFKGKNIADILAMTVEEAWEFFHAFPRIFRILDVLIRVGLWYITLWQSATTLSWWEAQRIKLAYDLAKRSTSKTLYILDEPTTWLHFSDVQKLLSILDALVEKGNTVVIIEHNLDVIANADAIIDIGPEWWEKWGSLIYAGMRDGILDIPNSFTGKALSKFERESGERRQ